ncbi:MAG: hypothetical protein KGL39_56870 [Patescibacteria group bacterium]|nr:hypothetical protein [Patescibacteria group bacterium]
MITIETPWRAVETQRRGLEALFAASRSSQERQFIAGALAVLDWIEHGEQSPLEQLSPSLHAAVAEDARG